VIVSSEPNASAESPPPEELDKVTAPEVSDLTDAPAEEEVVGGGPLGEVAGETGEAAAPSAERAEAAEAPVEQAEAVAPPAEQAPAVEEPVEQAEAATEEQPADEPEDDGDEDVEPLELVDETETEEELKRDWYILKVQVNREESIRDALQRRVKIEGLDRFFGDIVVPTEDIAEFTKTGKRRIVKRKLYPGYIMVHMAINDDTWFLVRETPGIGDFTGSAGKPTPMDPFEVERILNLSADEDDSESQIKTAIPFRMGDRVRVKEGYFQNFEGDVESVDEANGRVTVMINIFGRSTPVELEHWQIEAV
jgi:transcriptional antiterminator NusG